MKDKKSLLFNLSGLSQDYYRLAAQLHMLEIVRQKIDARDIQPFDKTDIMDELGRVQGRLRDMENRLQAIAKDLTSI